VNLLQAIGSRWFAPRVVHRLPGRLRLRVPLLTRVPDRSRPVAREIGQLFLLPGGIESVEIGFVTGTLLIRYDPARLDERQVLSWTQSLWRLICDHRDRLVSVPPERITAVVGRARPVLAEALARNGSSPQAIEIPSDVWA
jgi:hypothetical protein